MLLQTKRSQFILEAVHFGSLPEQLEQAKSVALGEPALCPWCFGFAQRLGASALAHAAHHCETAPGETPSASAISARLRWLPGA